MKKYFPLIFIASTNSIINADKKGLRVLYHNENNIEEAKIFGNFTSQTYFTLLNSHACSYFAPESVDSEYSGLIILFPPIGKIPYFDDWRVCSIKFINETLLNYKIQSPFVAYIATDWNIPQYKIGGIPTVAYAKLINSGIIAMPW